MKLSLGTIEVDDSLRRAVRRRVGKSGLATRKEIRDHLLSMIDMECQDLCYEMQRQRERDAEEAQEKVGEETEGHDAAEE